MFNTFKIFFIDLPLMFNLQNFFIYIYIYFIFLLFFFLGGGLLAVL